MGNKARALRIQPDGPATFRRSEGYWRPRRYFFVATLFSTSVLNCLIISNT